MKLFRSGSGKTKQPQQPEPVKQQPEEEFSIGSELSSRDQFDIIVRKQQNAVTASRTLSRNHQNHKSRGGGGGLLSYFSNDDGDDSTVSSITVDGKKRFALFPNSNNRGYTNESANSSWCCCSDNTYPTEYIADTNTLMHSARSTRSVRSSHMGDPYTQARYRAIQQQQQLLQQSKQSWLANASCAPECGPPPMPVKVTKPKRPRLFRRSGTAVRSSTKSLMSSSLFDTLSEDWDEEDGGKRVGSVRRKSLQFRKSLTWKRGKQQAM